MLQYAEYATLCILILCSILVLAVVLERVVAWRRTAGQIRKFQSTLKPLMEEGKEEEIKAACEGSPAPLASVLASIWAADARWSA